MFFHFILEFRTFTYESYIHMKRSSRFKNEALTWVSNKKVFCESNINLVTVKTCQVPMAIIEVKP